MTLVQQRFDEGTKRAALRVTNNSDESVTLDGIGLVWPGFGEFTVPYARRVRPGETIGHFIDLPDPECEADVTSRPEGLIRVWGSKIKVPLDDIGVRFARRLWREACATHRLRKAGSYAYGPPWRTRGKGQDVELSTSLRIVRREGDEPIRLTDALGSVLFELTPSGRQTLVPGQRSGTLPLRISPGRCDEHARSQASQPFLFRLYLRIGSDQQRLTLPLPPDAVQRSSLLRLLDRACPGG